jgi:hypothetical protein
VKIGDFIALIFDNSPQLVGHAAVWIHVQQDRPCVSDQAIRPTWL